MARTVFVKFLAIVLCAACLLIALASGGAIGALASVDLYELSIDQLQNGERPGLLHSMATRVLQRYLDGELGGVPVEALDLWYNFETDYPFMDYEPGKWFYEICDSSLHVVAKSEGFDYSGMMASYSDFFWPTYRKVTAMEGYDSDFAYHWNPYDADQPVYYSVQDAQGNEIEFTAQWVDAAQEYRVSIYLLEGAYHGAEGPFWQLLETLYYYRYTLIVVCLVSLLAFFALLVFLCCVAARKRGTEELRPGGLNRIPLDIYLALVLPLLIALVWICVEVILPELEQFQPWWMLPALMALLAYVGCLLVVGFLFACAAQMKAPGAFWYKHSFAGAVSLVAAKGLVGLFQVLKKWLRSLWPLCKRIAMAFWELFVAACKWLVRLCKKVWRIFLDILRACWELLGDFMKLLPLTWQWLLTAIAMVFIIVLTFNSNSTGVMIGLFLVMAIVLYGAHCFGALLDRAKHMSQGDLEGKVEDKWFIGAFQDFAGCLNAVADVAMEAARNQMKSERMKAELVTNVSHDIKTPLTSIINYVDLLQSAQTKAQEQEYLEVLERQSLRLKKLIEDLIEMSKASTGNMTVELSSLDPVETVNQALGEFADKLESAGIQPIFKAPEGNLRMMADGRLAWRVLSNLLSNAVKYAMPGTRLYIDIAYVDHKVLISLKNISREPLNISSEELMERFVRGDESRNTEGSGLGLNIAKNLMELQKGQLQLLVDGDFFKATLFFPES